VSRKFIIDIRDDIDDLTVARLFKHVVQMGKVSREKDQDVYCHATMFDVDGRKVMLYRKQYTRDGLNTFVIMYYGESQ
jgi:hypothetical protein